MIILFNIWPKPAILYLWSGIVFVFYTMNELKSYYGEPRPYWVSDEIVGDRCATGFGNPSGHMLNNVFLWVTVYLHYFYAIGEEQVEYSKGIKITMTSLIIIMTALMAKSRVFLGAHTFNEVLYGALLGVTLAFIGHYKVKPFVIQIPELLISQDNDEKYQVRTRYILITFIVTFAIPISIATLMLWAREDD